MVNWRLGALVNSKIANSSTREFANCVSCRGSSGLSMSADRRFPGWVRYSGVGLELAGATAGLSLVGYWIDRRFGTQPWGILGGVIIGLVGGLYNLVRESL